LGCNEKRGLNVSVSNWFRPARGARATLPGDSQASRQDVNRLTSDLPSVELPRPRRRLRRVKVSGFSPITHLLLVLLGSFLIVYLLRSPLDTVLPGTKAAIESTMARSADGMTRTAQTLGTTAEQLYWLGARTVDPYARKTPSAGGLGTRAVKLPYYADVPALPRLAVRKLYMTKHVRFEECGQGCSVLRMPDKSLEPTIKKGQLMLFDSNRVPAPGDVVWVAYGSRAYLRRYFPSGGRARLAADNTSFREITLARSELHINGVLVRVLDPG